MKLTDWFWFQNPDLIGYYETKRAVDGSIMMLFWDGYVWRASEHSPRQNLSTPFYLQRAWRGLAEDPSKTA